MFPILEGIFKGFIQWLYALLLEITEYIANGLLDVFNMDLRYFETVIPVTADIFNIINACGWALLLGNLVFQAAKGIMSGLGFEAEDPKTLFARTFVFAFLLLASRQVCEIGLGMAGTVITLLQIPPSIAVTVPDENLYAIAASWLLAVIVGLVLMWQIIRLFFEIGERYFLVGFLTLAAPLAFAMGGSKSTADIFKGWARMYASMCLMMVLNVVFLKMLLSAMGYMPTGAEVLPWLILVVAIARVARKIDNVIARIGLNPAITGEGLGRGLPGMLSYMVVRSVASNITRTTAGQMAGKPRTPSGRTPPTAPTPAGGRMHATSQSTINNRGNMQSPMAAPAIGYSSAARTSTYPSGVSAQGAAGTAYAGYTAAGQVSPASPQYNGMAGMAAVHNLSANPTQAANSQASGMAGMAQSSAAQPHNTTKNGMRQSSVANSSSRRSLVSVSTTTPGIAGRMSNPNGMGAAKLGQTSAPSMRLSAAEAASGTAGIPKQSEGHTPRASRYSVAPPGFRGSSNRIASPGSAGMVRNTSTAATHTGGAIINAPMRSSLAAQQNNISSGAHGLDSQGGLPSKPGTSISHGKASAATGTSSRGIAGIESRRSASSLDKPPIPMNQGAKMPSNINGNSPISAPQRDGRKAPLPGAAPANASAARQESAPRSAATSRLTKQQPTGTAGKQTQNLKANAAKNSGAQRPGSMPITQNTARIGGLTPLPAPAKKQDEDKSSRRSKGEETNERE